MRTGTFGIGVTAALLSAVAVLAWLLETAVGVPNASSVFLLAVVATASRFGTRLAVAAAVGSFLLYDFLFIEPRFTFTVADPGEWLNLVLLLAMGIVVGRLTAAQRERAEAAIAREREAVALFRVGRALATRSSTIDVLPELAAVLRAETGMERVRIALASASGRERMAADSTIEDDAGPGDTPRADIDLATAPDAAPVSARDATRRTVPTAASSRIGPSAVAGWTPPATHSVLRRTPGDAPAVWIRVHRPTAGAPGPLRTPSAAGWNARNGHARNGPGAPRDSGRGRSERAAYRVVIEAGGRELGSVWAVGPRSAGDPDQTATELLSAAADQIGQAVEQDRLAREAGEKEIARRSDALKTALLDSVSHDLRTPLASIRAAAGTLLDRAITLSPGAQEETAAAIDREADHLNRLVTNLLDLSRIEAGELKPLAEPFDLGDLVQATLDRLRPRLVERRVEVDMAAGLPPVLVDEVLIDQVLTNLIENAVKYTGPGARIRIAARIDGDAQPATAQPPVRITVEDDGPGVPDDALEHLFERFFRVRRPGAASRPGSGIGLTVVRGLVEAMGGRIEASPGSLGGLAVSWTVPSVRPPAAVAVGS